MRGNIPHDVAEAIAWGNQWQLGYSKMPPFNAWLAASFFHLFAKWPASAYIYAQAAVILTFWCVWRLGNLMLSPVKALCAVMLLEGIIYNNLTSVNITPDTLQTPLWALTTLCFYLALTRQKALNWLFVAIMSAVVIWTKYMGLLLLLPMFLLCILSAKGRKSFKNVFFYLAIMLFIALITPHFIWVASHDFITFKYADQSTLGAYHGNQHSFIWHFLHPISFFFAQLGAVCAAIVIAIPLMFKGKDKSPALNQFQWGFCLMMGLGPFALSLIYSATTGGSLVSRWGTPFFSLFGLLLLATFNPHITRKKFKIFCVLFASFALLAPIGRFGYLSVGPHFTHRARPDAYFPGKAIAAKVTKLWHKKTHNKPLAYVGAPHYLAAYLSVYSADHPAPYMSWSKRQSPWVNQQDLLQKGAIFAWQTQTKANWEYNMPQHPGVLSRLKKRYPHTQFLGSYSFKKPGAAKTPPVTIAVAYLPPGG